MELFIIIYLLGYILTFIMNLRYELKRYGEIRLSDLVFYIFISLGSWISFIITISFYYGDIIIYKSKNNESK